MEARPLRFALLAAVLAVCMGARFQTPNFIVETPDARLAKQFAEAAEQYRRELAIEWLGKPLPDWSQRCPITVNVGPHLGAGGATSFVFNQGEVYGWRMTIQGSAQRILDSVLPHEVTHMIFASHFREPLPRWADEGGATSVEHPSERAKHRKMLVHFLRNGRGISFSRMFAMKDYPADIMPLYAEGYSLAQFLIREGGRRKYVEFMGDGLETDDWAGAVRRHYGAASLGALQDTWLAWVREGAPLTKPPQDQPIAVDGGQMLAATGRPRPEPNLIYHVPKGEPAAYAPGSVIPASGPGVTMPLQVAAVKELPASGWHTAGTAPPAPATISAAEPLRSQVTRPQPFEQPRQTPPNAGTRVY